MAEAELPPELFGNRVRRIALADYLARQVRAAIDGDRGPRRSDRSGRSEGSGSGSGGSGRISIDAGRQEVLERTAVRLERDFVEARIEVGLPAAGRRILGRQAAAVLTDVLPRLVERSLIWHALPQDDARAFVECIENQEHIRARLDALGLVAFVGDGSLLPRASGASDAPMDPAHALPFRAPDTQRISIELLNPIEGPSDPLQTIEGMAIRKGITLIVGGGYHGKSTLLRALECAVHPHIPGDGREWVVAAPDLVKIRAEDGRSVKGVDIHGFIDQLPAQPGSQAPRSTHRFTSDDASGSTSQAANIVEAIEAGASGLLLDEDTSATNFMLRDARMQRLVHSQHEPITPFVDRIRELYASLGISTVLVVGGSGDYFDVADAVVMMRDFRPIDVSTEAARIAREHPTDRSSEVRGALEPIAPRVPIADSFDASRGRREHKISAKSRELIVFGRHDIDLRAVSQLLDHSQTRAVGMAMLLASEAFMSGREKGLADEHITLKDVLDALDAYLDDEGLDRLDPYSQPRAGQAPRYSDRHPGNYARPRRYEIAAAINRLRCLEVR
jgi:predicted ABC-class ATPase